MINLKDNRVIIFTTTLLAYIFVYGFEITHFTLSVDEEYLNNSSQTIGLGRWGHSLLHMYVLPEPWVPFFSLMTGIIFLSLSNIFICKYLKLDISHSIIFSILLVGMPQAAFQIEFSNQIDTYGISVFLSSLSIILFSTNSIKNNILFLLLTTLAMSIYQAAIIAPITLYILKSLFDYTNNESSSRSILTAKIKEIIRLIILLVGSYVVYKIILVLVAKIYNVPPSSYFSGFIGWHFGIAHGIKYGLGSVIKYTSFVYAPYGMKLFSIVLLALLTILIISLKQKRIEIFLCGLAALLSVFAINIGLGSVLPPRTLTQAPIVFAALITYVILETKKKDAGLIISLVILLFACMFSSRLFYSDYATEEGDSYVAQEMVSRIHQSMDDFDETKNPVFFTGNFSPENVWKMPNSDNFGSSFFVGGRQRIIRFLRVINLANFKEPPEDKVSELVAYSKNMPSWPAKNSIAMQDGIIIVKLNSDDTETEFKGIPK